MVSMSWRHNEAWSQTWPGRAQGCSDAALLSELSSFPLHSVHLLPFPLSLQPGHRRQILLPRRLSGPFPSLHDQESEGTTWVKCANPFQSAKGEGVTVYGGGSWFRVQRRGFVAGDHPKMGIPNLQDPIPDDWRWRCNNIRNKVHNKCNVLQLSWNHSPLWSMEKLCSTKVVPSAKKFGEHSPKRHLP